jgi:hypothetical protein
MLIPREGATMNQLEPYVELVLRDRLLRWSAIVAVALVWLAVAWTEPLALAALVLLVGSVYVVYRRRGPVEVDDELDLF